MNPLLEMLAEDKSAIAYRPRLNQITGSVTATILLQQIIYWYKQKEYSPFYKFKESCNHKLYKSGDSWCEELGFTRREFDSALSRIAIKKNKNTRDNEQRACAYYWITPERITYYTIDEEFILEKIIPLYSVKADSADTKSSKTPLPKGEKGSTKSTKPPVGKDDSAVSKSDFTALYNTEITSETTSFYLIVKGIEKSKKFEKYFNEFCANDSIKYRTDLIWKLNRNAEKYESSLVDIIDALKICVEKNKQGEISYFTGILKNKAEARDAGLNGYGKPDEFKVREYLRERLSSAMAEGYLVNYDLDWSEKLLKYKVETREDREPVAYMIGETIKEIKQQFKVHIESRLIV